MAHKQLEQKRPRHCQKIQVSAGRLRTAMALPGLKASSPLFPVMHLEHLEHQKYFRRTKVETSAGKDSLVRFSDEAEVCEAANS